MTEVSGYPWYAEGQFVLRSDGRSVCKVNGMESDAILIARAVNALVEQCRTASMVMVNESI